MPNPFVLNNNTCVQINDTVRLLDDENMNPDFDVIICRSESIDVGVNP